ncbi:MAG: flagellar motor switch protein FliM [Planctomycetaceae bacterium]|jgi:flagellar motor switch protein FliM|nr:flagellar motor switch protein FliM [Planctomycetaceae bacterium]
MAGEVLSQEEVENLLNIMSMGGEKKNAAPKPDPKPKKSAFSSGNLPAWGHEKITPYDFKRPERVGKEQMKALQTLHEGFGRKFAAGLSAMLRTIVEVKLTSVDQLTYSEFIFSLDNPTCFNLLRAEPLEGNLILDINPSVLYPMIDRMLGGGREPSLTTRRPLTEIELRLVSRITNLFLNEMKHAWENVLELDLKVIQVESNPQLIQIVPPNEVVVLVCFEVALIEVRGIINLCIPYNAIERISGKLASNSWVTYGRRQATPQSIEKISKSIRNMLVELKVKLGHTKIALNDLMQLRVGDVICTQKNVNTPLLVSVEGIPKYWAKPGAYKGYTAIQIEDIIEDPTEIIAQE